MAILMGPWSLAMGAALALIVGPLVGLVVHLVALFGKNAPVVGAVADAPPAVTN
ncbi:hypothetical protein [[Brevibacterium] flavum]|uniref:hypothetical protein n=1 Tax=[Brevibacterium] flavum TaxID=92706 RepID=UPI003B588A5C